MRMIFEVQDLAVASPATVSRCGMVYLEPSILGLDPFVHCWLNRLPSAIKAHREKLKTLFEKFLEVRSFLLKVSQVKGTCISTFYGRMTRFNQLHVLSSGS